jgi:acyl-CoA synthetase (AMP-forming)/AMP-acid ligase II
MSPMAFLSKPLRWLSAISRFGGTTSGGPNFAFDLCVRKIRPEQRDGLDLSTWKVAFNGSEPVRPDTLEKFAEYFAPCGFRPEAFYPCFGLAEATLIVSGGYVAQPPVIRWFDAGALAEGRAVAQIGPDCARARALVGCGQTLPDQEIVIADPETLTRCPPGKIGEIWVRGPSVARGYWQKPEASEATFRAVLKDSGKGSLSKTGPTSCLPEGPLSWTGGTTSIPEGPRSEAVGTPCLSERHFLRTGDLGFLDGGTLFVTGRIKDLIILHGANIYPQDIEYTVQQSHPRLRPDGGAVFCVERDDREQ